MNLEYRFAKNRTMLSITIDVNNTRNRSSHKRNSKILLNFTEMRTFDHQILD